MKGCFHQRITQQTIFFKTQGRLSFFPIFPANLRNVNFDKIEEISFLWFLC